MNKLIFSIFSALILLIVISVLNLVFLPSDILNYFPSFSLDNWLKPYNSLLADPVTQFEPWRIYAKESFANFRIPLWNDLNGGGVPFLAVPHAAIFYPLNIFYYILEPKFSLAIIHFLKLLLFFAFTFYYLRNLKLDKAASLIGALVATSSYMMLWLQWPQTNVFLLFPLLLLIFEKYSSRKINSNFIALNALVYFFGILGGHPETLFNVFVMHNLYIYLRTLSFRNVFFLTGSLILGLLLGAFLVIPFVEYLINSYAFESRSLGHISHLPIITLPFFIFPQALGAPHFDIYRSISEISNYAEYTAGSVGVVATILILISIVKFRRIKVIKLSLLLILISFAFSYLLGHLTEILKIPLISSNANQRFIAFAGFFASIPVGYAFTKLEKSRFKANYVYVLLFLSVLSFGFLLSINLNGKLLSFLVYEAKYLLFLFITTALFFIVLFSGIKNKILFVFIILTVQVMAPVAGYNKFTQISSYYPKNEFIKILLEHKDKRILQVGNMSLPPDINMVYGLESAENYDALDVKSYKMEFDSAFPVRNHLGLVDEVEYEDLNRFGIGIVISDYDMNSVKKTIQSATNVRIDLNRNINISIEGIGGNISGIRLLTENYNRLNTCNILVEVIENKTKSKIEESNLDCRNARDNMYYTIPVEVKFEENKEYLVTLKPEKIWQQNFIALRGNTFSEPFVELIVSKDSERFSSIYKKNNLSIFLVNGVEKIESNIPYELIHEDATRILIKTKSSEEGNILVKKTYYPGWSANINGKKTVILKHDPFMRILIPPGENVVEIAYKPLSSMIGLVVSFISALLFIVVSLKKILLAKNFVKLERLFVQKSLQALRQIEAVFLVKHFCFTTLIGVLLGVGFIGLLPEELPIPFTTSINWLTVNNHSLMLDYARMGILFLSILITNLAAWIILILKKYE